MSKVTWDVLKFTSLEFAFEADEQLYDFLLTFTTDDALRLIEPYVGEGFEA